MSVTVGPGHSGKTSALDTIALHWRIAANVAATAAADGARDLPLGIRYYMHGSAPQRTLRDLDRSSRNKHAGRKLRVLRERDPERIGGVRQDEVDRLLIDHAHAFDTRLVAVSEELATDFALDVAVAARTLDPSGRPYETIAGLMCLADEIEVRLAVCALCGGPATKDEVREVASGEEPTGRSLPMCRACQTRRQLVLLKGPELAREAVTPHLYAIVGSVYAGKTEEFIREIRQYVAAERSAHIQVSYPSRLPHRLPPKVYAYNDEFVRPRSVGSFAEVIGSIRPTTSVVFIDSLHAFPDFDTAAARALDELVWNGKTVVCTAVEVNAEGQWNRAVGHLLCYADRVRKLTATCMWCARPHEAIRVREVSAPATRSRFAVAEFGHEYRPICRRCITREALAQLAAVSRDRAEQAAVAGSA